MSWAPDRLLLISQRRISASALLRLLCLSFFPGALLAAVWRVFWVLSGSESIAAVWPWVCLLPSGFAIGYHFKRPLPASFAAQVADRSLGLKDQIGRAHV